MEDRNRRPIKGCADQKDNIKTKLCRCSLVVSVILYVPNCRYRLPLQHDRIIIAIDFNGVPAKKIGTLGLIALNNPMLRNRLLLDNAVYFGLLCIL